MSDEPLGIKPSEGWRGRLVTSFVVPSHLLGTRPPDDEDAREAALIDRLRQAGILRAREADARLRLLWPSTPTTGP